MFNVGDTVVLVNDKSGDGRPLSLSPSSSYMIAGEIFTISKITPGLSGTQMLALDGHSRSWFSSRFILFNEKPDQECFFK